MKQATALTKSELQHVLAVVASGKHSQRNRIALLLSHYAGLRVGEIATLRWWSASPDWSGVDVSL